jgi:hypothetical protein
MKSPLLKKFVFSVVSLVIMILFAACAGVGTPGTTITLSGSITKVDTANHSVTITSNGQPYTVTGLTDQEVQALNAQIGKVYTIHVTQNSDGSYTLTTGTEPTPGAETPEPNETPSTSTGVGSISFTGPVQSASASSLTVKLPDNSTITMGINASTDQGDLNGAQLSNGQLVNIKASANADGSFTATKIKRADSSDSSNNTVDFQGQTTQAVGSDNVLNFKVGNKSYSYTISSTAKLDDFGGNAHSIASGAAVKVEVTFTGTTGSVTKVSNASN